MSHQLQLEDLKWEGTNSRRCSKPLNLKYAEMKFMEPLIDFEEFQYTLKIHSIHGPASHGGFMIGVCDKNHPKKTPNKACYYAYHGGIGWGWNRGYSVKGPNGFSQNLTEKFGNTDLVTVSVNRREKWIEFLKNKKSMGKIENLKFPKDLVIAVALYYRVDFEVIEFSCKPKGPPPPTKEEIMMKELEERFMKEMEKMKLEMKLENEKLKEETKLLRITCDSQERQIEELRKKNEEHEELRMLYEELGVKYESQKREFDIFQRNYEDHFEMFHRTKYCLKSSITPQMFKKRDQVNYCFVNDTFHFRFNFSIESGPGADETSIDFEGLKMFVNEEPFSRLQIADNSIEFEETFTKIGRNELTCLFQNIKKTFVIDVEPSTLNNDRCELLLYRADLEPTGDLTKSSQPTEMFSSSDIIQIILKLVNENGVPLPTKFLEEEYLDVKMVKIDGGRRRMIRGVFSRNHEVRIDQIDSKGEFCVCSIGEKKLEKGTYEVKVEGAEVEVKKVFSIE